MRLDAQDRILSLSFERDPKEHFEIMIAAGRRLARPHRKLPVGVIFAGSVAAGILFGISMDVYRKLVLEPAFGPDKVPPLGVTMFQLLPVLVCLAVLYYFVCIRAVKHRRQALAERMETGKFIDVDIFREGLRTSSGLMTTMLDWRAIREIVVKPDRLEFDCDTSIGYIPARAFRDHPEFEAAARQIRRLWAEANSHPPAEAAVRP